MTGRERLLCFRYGETTPRCDGRFTSASASPRVTPTCSDLDAKMRLWERSSDSIIERTVDPVDPVDKELTELKRRLSVYALKVAQLEDELALAQMTRATIPETLNSNVPKSKYSLLFPGAYPPSIKAEISLERTVADTVEGSGQADQLRWRAFLSQNKSMDKMAAFQRRPERRTSHGPRISIPKRVARRRPTLTSDIAKCCMLPELP